MVRPACLSIIQFSLQILLNDHPEWASGPVTVVSEDKPLGLVLETNRMARESGVERGMRYSAALGICPSLRAAAVDEAVMQEQTQEIVALLYRYSPQVEECSFDPGTFWLDARGLNSLYRSAEHWITAVRSAVAAEGFFCRICIGFSRFGCYAGAKSATRRFHSSTQERHWTQTAPVSLLPLPPRVQQRLAELGIETVGEFQALPREGIRSRFGMETDAVFRFAVEEDQIPIQGSDLPVELTAASHPANSVTNRELLLREIESLLLDLLSRAVAGGLSLNRLTIELTCEDESNRNETVRPAAASRDAAVWLRLLRLRFEDFSTTTAILAISLNAEAATVSLPQNELFAVKNARDLAAGARAFARLRAQFGNGAVCRVMLQQEHRPDLRFALLPIDRPVLPVPQRIQPDDSSTTWRSSQTHTGFNPVDGQRRQLVRRIYCTSVQLHSRHGLRPAAGPFLISGKWWQQEAERHYYYAYHGKRLFWLYYDGGSNRWMMQGSVE